MNPDLIRGLAYEDPGRVTALEMGVSEPLWTTEKQMSIRKDV